MDLAFTKWYPLPFELAMWEVCEAVSQVRLKTVHCDPDAGRLMAESRTNLMDVGLVYISVVAHQNFGTTVSLMAEPYLSTFGDSMQKPFTHLLWAMDQRMVTKANHLAYGTEQAAAQGVKFDLGKGQDLGSRKRTMRKPRALGSIVLAALVAGLFLLGMVLQSTNMEMMLYLALAMPFIISACLIAAGKFVAGGALFLYAGFGIGLFFAIFTFLISVSILAPTLKGVSRAYGADIKRKRLNNQSEWIPSAHRPIVIEHR